MRARILCIFLLLFLGLGSIATKLYAVQVRQRDRLSERATRQYQRFSVTYNSCIAGYSDISANPPKSIFHTADITHIIIYYCNIHFNPVIS